MQTKIHFFLNLVFKDFHCYISNWQIQMRKTKPSSTDQVVLWYLLAGKENIFKFQHLDTLKLHPVGKAFIAIWLLLTSYIIQAYISLQFCKVEKINR